MLKHKVIQNWAHAIYQLSIESNKQSEMLEQINAICYGLNHNPSLTTLLSLDKLSKDNVDGLIHDTFGSIGIDPILINAIKYMVECDAFVGAREIFELTKKQLLSTNVDFAFGQIYSTKLLSKDVIDKITSKMENKFNKKIHFIQEIDESLIAGIKVVVGDVVYDGSLKSRFEDLKESIKKMEG
ncbi:F0F1 ATP synthase subunit delta [Spiroplasma sp. TIUS-1]|uniref:ATP synthase F1 subunit delta n=1 Tax=Spiroplasma sp. TIUS-1 TaxID=216963 RepID=UPI00139920E3|nr:ATP synthase F1 subunit delta [Spiroplasma sp. TIUS-1]QHX35606.1 F0F1 ATP synthase subunit delta [Spiroplasma sp. TIUS-1]